MKKPCLAMMVAVLVMLVATSSYAGSITVKSEKITSGPYYNPAYTNPGDCVGYARWLLPNLTKGKGQLPSVDLTSGDAKRHIINSSKTREKNVAVIDIQSGTYSGNDHLGVVLSVDDSGSNKSIVLLEASYPGAGIYKRTVKGKKVSISDLMKKVNIVGYYDYRK